MRATGAAKRQLNFVAATAADAQALVAHLPRTQTPAFGSASADQKEFAAALMAAGTRAVSTPALIVWNLFVFLLTVVGGAGLIVPDGEVLIRFGSNFGPQTLNGEWWRLLTSMFLHFGLMHVLFNMSALWINGVLVEKLFRSISFLLLYVVSGLSGSVASLYIEPQDTASDQCRFSTAKRGIGIYRLQPIKRFCTSGNR